jgi:hypothetical protein
VSEPPRARVVSAAMVPRSATPTPSEVSGVLVDLRALRRQDHQRLAATGVGAAATIALAFVSPGAALAVAFSTGFSWLDRWYRGERPPAGLDEIGDWIEAGFLDEAERGLDRIGTARGAPAIRMFRIAIQWRRGDLDGALRAFEQLLPLIKPRDAALRFWIRVGIVWLRFELQRIDAAYQELEILAASDAPRDAGQTVETLQLARYFYADEPAPAAAVASMSKDPTGWGAALVAWAHDRSGDTAGASQVLTEARASLLEAQAKRATRPRLSAWLTARLADV